MHLATSNCNPAKHKSSTMVGTPCRVAVTMHLTTCQERRNITDAFLRAAVPMRSITAGWQPAEQERRTNVGAALPMGTPPRKSGAAPIPQLSTIFTWNRALATVWCTLPASPSKSAPSPIFYSNNLTCKSSSRYSPAHFLSTTFADRGPYPQKQRPYFGDPGSHFTLKDTGSFQTVTLPNYLMMGGWHDDVVDVVVGMLTMTIVRNLEIFEVNFLSIFPQLWVLVPQWIFPVRPSRLPRPPAYNPPTLCSRAGHWAWAAGKNLGECPQMVWTNQWTSVLLSLFLWCSNSTPKTTWLWRKCFWTAQKHIWHLDTNDVSVSLKDQLKLPKFVPLGDTLRWWIPYFYPLAINHGNGKLARNVYNVYKLMLSYNDVPKKPGSPEQ